jgi:hypothetical protein
MFEILRVIKNPPIAMTVRMGRIIPRLVMMSFRITEAAAGAKSPGPLVFLCRSIVRSAKNRKLTTLQNRELKKLIGIQSAK